MARIGYYLASEEHSGPELVRQAALAEEAGFAGLWISDHFHPWNSAQGESTFVWSVLGAVARATRRIPVTTAVTCPIIRLHPAMVAQAAATVSTLMPGRFRLGLGTGEALNEHVVGAPWPAPAVRREMLEEAIEVIRRLWRGRLVSHRGRYFTVDRARLYSLPDPLPPIYVSAFGPAAVRLAGRVGDGLCSTIPDDGLVRLFEESGGAGKPRQAGMKVCWGPDEAAARRTAHRLWPNERLPGTLAQDLPTPGAFEAASTLVTEDMIASVVTCGDDPERHVKAIATYVEAGYTEVYVAQIGRDQDGFVDFYRRAVLPRLP
jgi:G6PDH family F420-dependent oxidoreductase